MQHPDEHTLSLFALREGLGTRLRESVERHLAKCHGCRAQVEELGAVYAHAEKRLVDEVISQPQSATESLTPSVAAISPERIVRSVRLSVAVGGAVQRFIDFARRRPIVTGVGTLAFASLAFLGVNAAWEAGKGLNGSQPAFFRMNAVRSVIEVFAKDNSRLWEFPIHIAQEKENPWLLSRTVASPILGNGETQLLTCTGFEEEGVVTLNALRTYDHRGKLLWVKRFGRNMRYKGEPYRSYFGFRSLVTIAREEGGGGRDILLSATDDRSPCAIVKVGSDSVTLGEYWHFGHLQMVRSGYLAGRDGEVLFCCGINDVSDRVDSSYPAIAVLDPRFVAGQTESTVTPGLGFPATRAELFYLRADQPRLPIPATSTLGKTGFYGLKIGQDSSLTFASMTTTLTGNLMVFYTFDNKMRLLNVWLDDTTRRVLTEQILGSASAVDKYLRGVRSAVRYWDGKAWRAEPTPVAHDQNPG